MAPIAGQDTTSFTVDTRRAKYLCFLKTPHKKKRARHFSESDDLVHWTPDHLRLYAKSQHGFQLRVDVAGIRVNCDVQGKLLVEVLDKHGRPIQGLAARDCRPITGDHLAANVRWTSGMSIGDREDRRLKLRFTFTRGKLYSFQVCEE